MFTSKRIIAGVMALAMLTASCSGADSSSGCDAAVAAVADALHDVADDLAAAEDSFTAAGVAISDLSDYAPSPGEKRIGKSKADEIVESAAEMAGESADFDDLADDFAGLRCPW